MSNRKAVLILGLYVDIAGTPGWIKFEIQVGDHKWPNKEDLRTMAEKRWKEDPDTPTKEPAPHIDQYLMIESPVDPIQAPILFTTFP